MERMIKMAVTKIRSKWVSGFLEFFGITTGDTVFKITESGAEGNLKGALLGSVSISKNADYALSDAEKANFAFSITATAGSKTITLGLSDGQIAFVYNAGDTNAYTLKNVSGDTGTSVATGKVYLVIASTTANASKVLLLN